MKRISVVIPVYNLADRIDTCIASLKRQTFPFQKMEVILVNDGSTDGSGEVCRRAAAECPNIVYLEQENRGVSAARNLGIRHATGKYIFYLDADDELAPDTIREVTRFFDRVCRRVDLVTYPLETIYHGRVLPPHFRYQFMERSGVYDLCREAFIGQTTMNIAVKNKFADNILFDEAQTYSEDQRYCCDVLGDTLKMGFCRAGRYIYHRSEESTSGKLAGACFIFEQCLTFFEQLFARYPHVPVAFQGLFVNDIYWKMACNIFFPYHYGGRAYDAALRRVKKLLEKCYPYVILDHPGIDYFEKFFLMRLKDEHSILPRVTGESFSLYSEGNLVSRESSLEMVLTKVAVIDGEIHIDGFLKSVFFQFAKQPPVLYAIENGGTRIRQLMLRASAHDYYLSHEATQRFFAARYRCRPGGCNDVRFEAEIAGRRFPVHYYFMPLVPFNHERKQYRYCQNGVRFTVEGGTIAFAQAPDETDGRLWLYYDCRGVPCDNGMRQFLHDIQKQDGIRRRYVVTDDRQWERIPTHLGTAFGSDEHRMLLAGAEKVITAYIEENNILPYPSDEWEDHAPEFHFQTIYLQHGVLHIKMPWKYSPEKIMADKVVVSTEREWRLFRENGFEESALWKTRMPRFDTAPRRPVSGGNRILYAPSWRSYLAEADQEGRWAVQEEKFLQSHYFRNIQRFLNDPALNRLLADQDFLLEVKFHPIFRPYQSLFSAADLDRVVFVEEADPAWCYRLMMTDFSSYLYDFVYCGVPVMSYIPDLDEFLCGMNGYRELNYGPAFWKGVSSTPEQVIRRLEAFFRGEAVNQVVDRFFPGDDVMDNIYQRLMRSH